MRMPAVVPALFALLLSSAAVAAPEEWRRAWPSTDFSRHSVPFDEIISGGVARDQIPPIDEPRFRELREVTTHFAPNEPVIALQVDGDLRAYPLSILLWHEIVNDEVGGVPLAITYCPLCDAAVVFDRRVDGRVLDFGVSGMLRHSDLIMWDRQTESWWQQFLGEAVVGEMTGALLDMVPSRVESFARFKERAAGTDKVLVPSDTAMRPYGQNPYAGYDGARWPFLYRGNSPEGIAPLARVIAVEDRAWSLDLLRERGRIEHGDLVVTWEPGQHSVLDSPLISQGRDVGNALVQRRGDDGSLTDAVHDVTFAFAFHAFRPDSPIHVRCEAGTEPLEPLVCD
jgi:hypothetical protein